MKSDTIYESYRLKQFKQKEIRIGLDRRLMYGYKSFISRQ